MSRRLLVLFIGVFAVSMAAVSVSSAQNSAEDQKAKLRALRENRAVFNLNYEEELHKLKQEKEQRLGKIKIDYRKAHEEIMSDIDGKMKQVRLEHESKIKPILKEESQLMAALGSSAVEDFAKTKVERGNR